MNDANELPPPTVVPHRPSVKIGRERIDRLLADQRDRCQKGEPFRAEIYLEQEYSLADDTEALLDLICNEIVLRESKGESPTLEEYTTRFPRLSEHLRIQFEVDGALQSDSERTVAGATVPIDKPADGLAGYEILEVLGRGGMGVVYKARQRSLNRIVALKMVRSGAHAGEEDLKRFDIEAEAVARLQHPNVVQIYEVGHTADGPFLALEYVDGGSLQAQLEEPWPPVKAARLMEKLARAMHYAHERGIVHRDLKPANILLQGAGIGGPGAETKTRATETQTNKQRQTTGGGHVLLSSSEWDAARPLVPKITDFGLAKMFIEGSKGPTQTGDFLGTPCYTAPEQASGRIHEIGPCSDVYALGAILYELLTGRPPFEGATILDTLDQVRSKEPIPPTRLQHRVPRDLETICLKCLEKDPRRRYTTAELLADDLDRFLLGRPILARPVGFIERTVKWMRRRPALAAATILSIVLVAGGFVGALWYAHEMGVANEATNQALKQAEKDLLRAVKAVRRILVEVAAVDLADVPQLEQVRKNVLLEAKGMMDEFLQERGDHASVRHLAGQAYASLGDIHDLLDESTAAESAYVKAIELLKGEAPSTAQRQELARAQNNLGGLLKKLARFSEAEKILIEALEIRKKLAADDNRKDYVRDLAISHHDLGTVIARLPKRRDDAEKEYRSALDLQTKLSASSDADPTFDRERARTLNNLGILLRHVRPDDAKKALRDAVAVHEALVARTGSPASRRELARTVNNLAGLQGVPVPGSEAEATYKEAIGHLKSLVDDFSKVPAYRQELAGVYRNRAIYWEEAEKYAEAERDYLQGMAIRRQLAKEFPAVPDYQQGLAKMYVELGSLRERQQRFHDADGNYRTAVEMLEAIAKPGSRAIYHCDLGLIRHQWGLFHIRRSRFKDLLLIAPLAAQTAASPAFNRLGICAYAHGASREAVATLWAAEPSFKAACSAEPRNAAFRAYSVRLYEDIADWELELGNHANGAKAARELATLSNPTPDEFVLAAKLLALCARRSEQDQRLESPGRRTQTDGYAREAVELLRRAKERGELSPKLRDEPEFESIRERPDFKQLFENVRQNQPQIACPSQNMKRNWAMSSTSNG